MGDLIDKCHNTKLSVCSALLVLFINLILPGFGTILAGLLAKNPESRTACLFVGLFQVLTDELLIGIVWAWYTSILFLMNAIKRSKDDSDSELPRHTNQAQQQNYT